MDFSRTEAQDELAGLTRQILADRGGWAELAGAGVLAAGLPEALGGAGTGLLEHCSVLAEIGRAAAPLPYLASIVLGAGALARFSPPGPQRRFAEGAGRGELILTAALAEDDSDDPRAPAASARRVGDGWVLSGVKTTVPAATEAGLFLVPAATEPGGAAVFLVTPDDAGVTVADQQVTGGAAAGRLELDGVALDGDRLLGRPDGEAAGWLYQHATVGLCAQQLGVLERALELTAEYARSRVQFGRPIGAFQAVAQRLADGYVDVEAVRLSMWQAAWRLAAGLPCETEIATAKFWAADAGHRIAHTAVHVHGGVGIDLSYPVQRYFVAAKAGEFALGGATTQLRRIGALLASEG
ncbi:MAG TPA: acyl-CoA dehydrogenase family protein [Streptosporangiaceae bacterium]|jgi:acyl-CoA dehydrogenase|nr:acyl-CoA dehydrogenase family protein [Streptosporangiaceae bacterium]